VGEGLDEDLIVSGPVDFTIAAGLPGVSTQYSGVASIEITNIDRDPEANQPSGDISFNDYGANEGTLLEGTSVPEPCSMVLMVTMLLGAVFVARRRIELLQPGETGRRMLRPHLQRVNLDL
jgi:hypothetical protein